ncbi:MAG TPA: hypothetical protein DEE98_07230 [Elusimicrobia bacterium]|nr:MAG: hypothetical protein A2278_00135 [Elusimicrobia bacterium RIFOXYA12_FULL_49_49]OGS09216.1 MAG: hypothetical protein A2204_00965 [Elusimicrobia bacterium RIFOXYA1_FULL_47_7]OGS11464.1 MAG: hypothetical protein A2386_00070 [Elusimicrobia bacterium RIFOXYB1_FULL_48_9]OGS15844.1 MAG: hypothetical protein A2251_04270 [Elusimicrobia bacterium RIFOXYA2_FULL_47_53]OGS27138.1 MAG: hypothetical protein A2339_00520 [Elusimicrobia bacterium RIFOXYB12_FULL_50_12]OGS31176.1 MAG: hypothetical protein
MPAKKANNRGGQLVDKEYIKRCLSLTPEQRLAEMQKLNDFLFNTMPEKSRKAWFKLKEKGF